MILVSIVTLRVQSLIFYDASYQQVQRDTALPIDKHGQCVTSSKIEIKEPVFNDKVDEQVPAGDKKSNVDARNKNVLLKTTKTSTSTSVGNAQASANHLLMKNALLFSLSEKRSISQLKNCVMQLTLVMMDVQMTTFRKPRSSMSLIV